MKGIFLALGERTCFFMIKIEFFIIGEGHCVFIVSVGIVRICAIMKLFMSTQRRYTWRVGSFLWSLCRFDLCLLIFDDGNGAINSFINIYFIEGVSLDSIHKLIKYYLIFLSLLGFNSGISIITSLESMRRLTLNIYF